jgi:hypothetical protein
MNAKDADECNLRSQAFVFDRFDAPPSPPEFSVVRSSTVARQLHRTHTAWEATPGASGLAHSLTNRIRIFKDPTGRWRGRWDIILKLADLSASARKAGAA